MEIANFTFVKIRIIKIIQEVINYGGGIIPGNLGKSEKS